MTVNLKNNTCAAGLMLAALLMIALVLQGMLLGGKIRKLEEDRL